MVSGRKAPWIAPKEIGPAAQAPAIKPKTWAWYCRMDRGKDVIDEWHTGLSKKARANFERARDHLRAMPIEQWSKPHPASFIQDHHIYVIRFKDEASKQWRVFGHADAKTFRFVMTLIATEKDDVYNPADAGKRAEKFRQRVESDFASHTCRCFVHADDLRDARIAGDLCIR